MTLALFIAAVVVFGPALVWLLVSINRAPLVDQERS